MALAHAVAVPSPIAKALAAAAANALRASPPSTHKALQSLGILHTCSLSAPRASLCAIQKYTMLLGGHPLLSKSVCPQVHGFDAAEC